MNILIPLYAILSASYLHDLYKNSKRKMIKILLGIQYFILSIVFIGVLLLCFHVFKFEKWFYYVLLIACLGIITYFCLKREAYYMRIITLSVCSSLLLNAVLNMHFYPRLLEYQGGSNMAEKVKELDIPKDDIYKITTRHTWALDFYNRNPVNIISLPELENKAGIWIYADDMELETLLNSGFSLA